MKSSNEKCSMHHRPLQLHRLPRLFFTKACLRSTQCLTNCKYLLFKLCFLILILINLNIKLDEKSIFFTYIALKLK